MPRKLESKPNGQNGAMTISLLDIDKGNSRSQIGKLKVQKCALVWYDKCETKNNMYKVSWDEFIEYMRKHPNTK